MTRQKIVLWIFLDLICMAGAGFMAWSRYEVLRLEMGPVQEVTVPLAVDPVEPVVVSIPTAVVPEELIVQEVHPLVSTGTAIPTESRRSFVYDSVQAKTVQLVGDFNKWNPQDLVRNAKGRWTLSVVLSPGDYAYSFIVDGITKRDPYQRRTDDKGRSFLSVP